MTEILVERWGVESVRYRRIDLARALAIVRDLWATGLFQRVWFTGPDGHSEGFGP